MAKRRLSDEFAVGPIANAPALISEETVVTYAEYHGLVAGAVDWLSRKGIKPGDRVGLLAANSTEYVVFLMALISIGAVACPLSTRYPVKAIHEMLDGIACRTVLYASGQEPKLEGVQTMSWPALSGLESGRSMIYQRDMLRDATLLFTSGTGALPKAVLHTYANHYYSALGSNDNIALQPGERWLLSLPLYHVGGLGILFRCLLAGAAVVVPEHGEVASESISRYKVTHLSLVPAQLSELIASAPGSDSVERIKCVLVGGSSVPVNLIDDAVDGGLAVRTTYGSTEMASQVTTSAPGDSRQKLHTSGRLLRHRELRISDDKEILLRGKTLFKGYISSSGLVRPFDDDGWFRTGDMGRLDSEGYLVVSGRKDNMFISGGENIHPEEIEAHIRSVAGIDDAVVVAVDDATYGQRPVAFVKATGDYTVDADKLLEYLRDRLPKYKMPVRIMDWPAADGGEMKPDRRYLTSLAKKLGV